MKVLQHGAVLSREAGKVNKRSRVEDTEFKISNINWTKPVKQFDRDNEYVIKQFNFFENGPSPHICSQIKLPIKILGS